MLRMWREIRVDEAMPAYRAVSYQRYNITSSRAVNAYRRENTNPKHAIRIGARNTRGIAILFSIHIVKGIVLSDTFLLNCM